MEGFSRRGPRRRNVWEDVLAAAVSQLAGADGEALRAYLRGRGADARSFELGGVTSLGALLEAAKLPVAEARKGRVLTSAPGDDWWRGRVVGVVRDISGTAVGMWGRAVSSETQGPRYLMSGLGAPAYYGPVAGARLVVVEGYFDALMARTAGVSAVAIGGTSVSRETVEGWCEAKEVVLCLDSDKAGHEGLVRIVRMLPHITGMPPVSVLLLPADSDLDEVLREEPGCFEELFAGRVPWLTHVVRSVLQAPLSPADEVIAVRRVGAVLKASLPGWPAEVGLALKEVSRLIQVDERFIERVVDGAGARPGTI